MKFYVAGKWQDRARVQKVMGTLTAEGHIVTLDWTTHIDPENQSILQEWAERDIKGVMECDTYIGVFDNDDTVYTGALVEMGVALALGKRVWIMGNAINNCIFLAHPLVAKFQTMTDMLRVLDGIPRR